MPSIRTPWDTSAAAPPTALVPPTGFRRRLRALRLGGRRGITLEGMPSVGRDVRVEVDPGARLVLRDGCVLHDGCRIHVRGGTVEIGRGAVLGGRCAIVAHESVTLGERCRLGDGVVIADWRPAWTDAATPTRDQGVVTAPVAVGAHARIGPGAVLEAGTTVPPRTAVAAHRVLSPVVR